MRCASPSTPASFRIMSCRDLIVVLRDNSGSSSGGLVDLGGQVVDSFQIALAATECLHNLNRGTDLSEGLELQDLDLAKVFESLVGVLIQERVEHSAGLIAVFREDIPLLDVAHAFLTSQWRLIECNVADQVERAQIITCTLGQRLEQYALLEQFVQDDLLAVGLVPLLEEVVEGGELALDSLAGVVLQRLGDELAVLVVVLVSLTRKTIAAASSSPAASSMTSPGSRTMYSLPSTVIVTVRSGFFTISGFASPKSSSCSGGPSQSGSAKSSVALRKSRMVKKNLP